MKTLYTYISFFLLCFLSLETAYSQMQQTPKHQPYADQKMYHLGFHVGVHTQDVILMHTGYTSASGEAWFAEIPSYSMGFNVGISGDRYLNEYLNLRVSPTLYFGEKGFVFKEQITGEEYKTTFKTSYISLPVLLKFSANRINNYRPYLLAGGYATMDLSSKKDMPLRFNKVDYGLEFGIGCNIYFPLFKLCPELKFSLGLTDLINKDNSDITDNDMLKYRDAISSGKSRMISLIFNFE